MHGHLDIRSMERPEIEAVLRRNRVGRIAFCLHDYPSIAAISYVYDGDSLFGRTQTGVKLATLRHNDRVAFEVDEIDAPYVWRSVVAHGTFIPLIEGAPGLDTAAFRRGLELLRRLDPDVLTERDPTPEREILFRIAIRELTGRASSGRREQGEPAGSAPADD